MIKKLLCAYLAIATLLLFFEVANKVSADTNPKQGDITVTATVPDTTVTFSGYAARSSTVYVKEGGTTIGTTTANASGHFSRTIVGTPGLHDFSLYYIDTQGRSTPETAFNNVNLIVHVDTPVNNIHLPPTISLSKSTIDYGDSVSVLGQGAPGSKVRVYLNGGLKYNKTISGGGSWVYTFSSGYSFGNNTLRARLTRSGYPNSNNSHTLTLNVNQCKRSDLNCDGFVNLTDFSILLYYWGSSSKKADINGDGTVSLIDFSIMMFDWTG